MTPRIQGIRRMAFTGCALAVLIGLGSTVQADDGHAPTDAAEAAIAPVHAPTEPGQIDKAEADGIIFERQQIMIQLSKDAEMLGMIVAGLEPRDKLAETARAVANGAREAKASFQMHVEGGRSKPEVWSNWADYSQRMDSFATKTEAMAVLAEAGDFNGVVETLGDAMPCKACHDVYRGPRQPAS